MTMTTNESAPAGGELREIIDEMRGAACDHDNEGALALAGEVVAWAERLAALSCPANSFDPARIGWVFQHEETGLTVFCPDDGVNTAESFAAANPRHLLYSAAYSAPQTAPAIAPAGPAAYCRSCQSAGMSNCAHFNECSGATCITCHRPLNVPALAAAPQDGEAAQPVGDDTELQFSLEQSWMRELNARKEAEQQLAATIAERAEIREVLFGALDRDRDDITTLQLAVVAANALHWTRAERDRAVKDAERYRWLRDRGPISPANAPCAYTFPPNDSFPYPIGGDDLDTAIDAAIAAAAGDAGGES